MRLIDAISIRLKIIGYSIENMRAKTEKKESLYPTEKDDSVASIYFQIPRELFLKLKAVSEQDARKPNGMIKKLILEKVQGKGRGER